MAELQKTSLTIISNVGDFVIIESHPFISGFYDLDDKRLPPFMIVLKISHRLKKYLKLNDFTTQLFEKEFPTQPSLISAKKLLMK